MKTIIVSLLLFLVHNHLFGQDPVLPEQVNRYADSLIQKDEKQFLKWIDLEIASSLNSNNHSTAFLLLNKKAEFYRIRGDYENAILSINKGIDFQQFIKNKLIVGEGYTILGKTYAGKGDYDASAKAFIESLRIMEKGGHKQGAAFALNNIGIVYDLQKNYVKALDYYLQSLDLKKQLKDSSGIAAAYNNIGITYFNLNDLSAAKQFHLKALEFNQLLKREESVGRSFNNLGLVALNNNEAKLSYEYFRKALVVRLNFDNKKDIATTYNNLGKASFELEKSDSASYYNNKAYALAKEINSFGLLKEVVELKSKIAQRDGDLVNALYYKDLLIAYNDSLINEENIKSVAEYESKYQHEKMKRQLSEKNLLVAQKNEKLKSAQFWNLVWIVLSSFSLLLILFLIYSYSNIRRHRVMLKAQLILLEERKRNHEQKSIELSEQLKLLNNTLDEKEALLKTFYQSQQEDKLPPELLSLSERETEVLSHLALGWSDQEIADKLFLSKATVKTHLRRIYSKLLVRGRSEAVSIAHKYKLIGYANNAIAEEHKASA